MANEPTPGYQVVNFHFSVLFSLGSIDVDAKFQAVSGMDATIETEVFKEGGENRFEHVLPVRRKYGPLILKRGYIQTGSSAVTKWLQDAFENETIKPISTVTINLLNEQHNPLVTWMITNVWPRSWKLGELNAEQNAVLIETLELNYNILVTDPGGDKVIKQKNAPDMLKPRNTQTANNENTV